jgi:fatty-acid desaturase
MPNWTWLQWIFAIYIAVGVTIALIAWIAGHKKAPVDVAASKPEQRKMVDISILREAEKVKRKNKEEN